MHIGLIGGLDRNHRQYGEVAENAGHSFEHHTGHMAGRGSGTLAALVERAEVLIVVTDVNSHTAVLQARRLSRSYGRPCVLVRRFGLHRFRALVSKLTGTSVDFESVSSLAASA